MDLEPVFYEIYGDLPRGGPGDRTSTLRAFECMTDLPEIPEILDVGCGPGMQTLDLARAGGRVVALDNFPAYLERLRSDARLAGLEGRVRIVEGDMKSMPFREASFDVVWAEGSIFIAGFQRGLRDWRRLLRPRGWLAATEATWLRPDPPAEVREFWENVYPAITVRDENARVASNAGYEVVESFALPESAWWNDYYRPLEARLGEFARRDDARAVVEAGRLEIEMYRRYSDCYGYVFYVMRRTD